MKKIYTTYNLNLAQMIKDLLQTQGIPALIKGSSIDAQLGQPITIWIENQSDEAKAVEIISSIER